MKLTDDLVLAHRMADVATAQALARPIERLRTWRKADGTEVSEADIAVEQALLDLLAQERPGDSVLSEECGSRVPNAAVLGRRWVIDPIDGTRTFIAGGRNWGTHITLEVDGNIVVAVLTRPTEGYRYWAAQGGGAYLSHAGDPLSAALRLSISHTDTLSSAKVSGYVDPGSPAAAALRSAATWVDRDVCTAGALLEGRIDALLDEGGRIWDQAPVALLVREAGGFVCDPRGGERIDLGWDLYGSPGLRRQLLAVLDPFLPA